MADCSAHFEGKISASCYSTNITRNYRSSTATLYKCVDCGHHFFSPDPNQEDISFYYNQDFGRHSIDVEYSGHNELAINALYDSFCTLLGSRDLRIHDDGCGFGHMVWFFNRAGARATGTDVGEPSIALGRARGNEALSCELAPDFLAKKGETINAITLMHTLEHYTNPVKGISALRPYLDDRGILCIWVPNAGYLPTRRLGIASDPHCHFPMHMQYFTPSSLGRLLIAAGYSLISVETTPNFAFTSTMQDDLLMQAVGKSSSSLKNPVSLLAALAENNFTYELRAYACRSDSQFFRERIMSDSSLAQLLSDV